MDTSDQFKDAEEEYLRLKGQFAAGRITQEQFTAAVKQLIVEDGQGQMWALQDNGFWGKYDGPPKPKASASAPAVSTPAPVPSHAATSALPSFLSGRLAIVLGIAASCVILACIVGIAGLIYATGPSQAKVGSATIVLPTLPPTSSPALAPTDAATAPVTEVFELPTEVPVVPTSTVSPTSSAGSQVGQQLPTPTATVAPGIYVTGIRIDPPTPARKVDVQFSVLFLNTTGADRNFRLVVFIFKTSDLNHSLGQTTATNATIPSGEKEQKLQGWKLVGGGGCENLVARAGFVEGKKVNWFKKPDGTTLDQPFSVC